MEKKDINISKIKLMKEEYSYLIRHFYPMLITMPLTFLHPAIPYMSIGYLIAAKFGNLPSLAMQEANAYVELENCMEEEELKQLKDDSALISYGQVIKDSLKKQNHDNEEEVYYLAKREVLIELRNNNLIAIGASILLTISFCLINDLLFYAALGGLIASISSTTQTLIRSNKNDYQLMEAKERSRISLFEDRNRLFLGKKNGSRY